MKKNLAKMLPRPGIEPVYLVQTVLTVRGASPNLKFFFATLSLKGLRNITPSPWIEGRSLGGGVQVRDIDRSETPCLSSCGLLPQ